MSDKISFNDLKALYDVSKEVADIEPWTFMQEDENFILQPFPDGETFYACILGSAGINYSLVFYRGHRGWQAFQRMHDNDMTSEEAVHSLDCLNLDFEPWSRLDPESRKRLKRMGLGPGPGILPMPIVYRPSRKPGPPGADDLATLTALLHASLPVLRRSLEEPAWLRRPPERGLLFKVLPGSGKGTPAGEWVSPPVPTNSGSPDPAIEVAPPDILGLRRLQSRDLRPCSAWEIHLADSGAAVKQAASVLFPMVGLFADSATGFVAGAALAPVEEMPTTIPRELHKAVETHGRRPEAFHVLRDDVAAWLKPLSETLSIPVIRKSTLPQAEAAHEALREAMLGRGPLGAPKGRTSGKQK